jgi:Nucleotidyltransferase domain
VKTNPDGISAAKELAGQLHLSGDAIAVVGGSVARGEANENSDLDIIVLEPGGRSRSERVFTTSGWPVHLLQRDLLEMTEYLRRPHRFAGSDPSWLHLLAGSQVVSGDASLAAELSLLAKEALRRGPKPLTTVESQRAIRSVQEKLEGVTNPPNSQWSPYNHDYAIRSGVSLALALPNLVLAHTGNWPGSGRWQIRQLQDVRPDIATELVDGLGTLSGVATEWQLIEVAEECLQIAADWRPTYGVDERPYMGRGGPPQYLSWSETLAQARDGIGDALDDLRQARSDPEVLFGAALLVDYFTDYWQWRSGPQTGKLYQAFARLHDASGRDAFANVVQETLQGLGGRPRAPMIEEPGNALTL